MPDGVDTSAVADALYAGSAPDRESVEPARVEPAPTPAAPESNTEVEPGATTEDSFTHIDPNTLPEELQVVYKQLQGDYTRKTQAVAEQRKQFENLGVDPSQAAEAVQFVEALQSDPNYQYQVFQALSTQLQQAGYTPAQADAFAGQQMAEYAGNDGFSPENDYQEFGSDPRDAMLADMYNRMQNFEQQQQMNQMAADLQRQEMAIRQAHPDYKDTDLDSIYNLAVSFDGDLHKANNAYQEMRSNFLNGYLQARTSAPAAPPAATGHAQTPAPVSTMKEAKSAAREMLMNVLGQS